MKPKIIRTHHLDQFHSNQAILVQMFQDVSTIFKSETSYETVDLKHVLRFSSSFLKNPKFTTNSFDHLACSTVNNGSCPFHPHWATPDVPYGDTHILVRGGDFRKCCCKTICLFGVLTYDLLVIEEAIFCSITVGSYQQKIIKNQKHCETHHITHTHMYMCNHRFHRLLYLLITSCLYISRIPPCPHQLKPTNDLMESN